MAITRYAGDRFVGLESEKDSLLIQVLDGAIYLASDSRISYTKINGAWLKDSGIYASGIGDRKSTRLNSSHT